VVVDLFVVSTEDAEIDGASDGDETRGNEAGTGLANGRAGVKEWTGAAHREWEIASADTVPFRPFFNTLRPGSLLTYHLPLILLVFSFDVDQASTPPHPWLSPRSLPWVFERWQPS
jgi:hypothetical protein